ncbi:acyltransferase [Maribacter sp. TH_r10]|uniref:acyltransferase n=1 Tax=Maribacter sp. TH_r10 TaxID=3082086 RepID=UPI002953093C|nr:acyltransferase [Maribacter sp. TH_r10]MDV7140201.1 acyltransferase [Maribacter sp. TH_r10]
MIKKVIAAMNGLYLCVIRGSQDTYSGFFFLTRIKKDRDNIISLVGVNMTKNHIKVTGRGNLIESKNNLIENSKLVINGENNKLILHPNVKLRNADVVIRGSDNVVEIGKGTTFGGVRIVNVGQGNVVDIGENCLFSDHIEVWASDTHSIFNEENVKINTEKPIHIGDNVWVGSRVIVLKGVKIGDGGIVGMGTLVSKDIPPKSIVVGNPNRVVKNNVYWTNEY